MPGTQRSASCGSSSSGDCDELPRCRSPRATDVQDPAAPKRQADSSQLRSIWPIPSWIPRNEPIGSVLGFDPAAASLQSRRCWAQPRGGPCSARDGQRRGGNSCSAKACKGQRCIRQVAKAPGYCSVQSLWCTAHLHAALMALRVLSSKNKPSLRDGKANSTCLLLAGCEAFPKARRDLLMCVHQCEVKGTSLAWRARRTTSNSAFCFNPSSPLASRSFRPICARAQAATLL